MRAGPDRKLLAEIARQYRGLECGNWIAAAHKYKREHNYLEATRSYAAARNTLAFQSAGWQCVEAWRAALAAHALSHYPALGLQLLDPIFYMRFGIPRIRIPVPDGAGLDPEGGWQAEHMLEYLRYFLLDHEYMAEDYERLACRLACQIGSREGRYGDVNRAEFYFGLARQYGGQHWETLAELAYGYLAAQDYDGAYNRSMKLTAALLAVVLCAGCGGPRTETFSDGSTYTDEFKDGKANGQGTVMYADGTTYTGEWKDSLRHGQGESTEADGTKYAGEWKDGFRHGRGVETLADGTTYTGEWQDGARHGALAVKTNGGMYAGEWKDNKRHGQGTMTYANGDNYTGEFKDGKESGKGTMTWVDGLTYAGEWTDDNFHGQGAFTFVNGDKYAGSWQNRKYHGHGVYTWADGGTYTGEFVDGERNGQGTEKFTTGDEYTGEFKDGRFHGQGSYTSTELDGHVSTGKWEKGYLSAAPKLARTLTSGQRAVNQP